MTRFHSACKLTGWAESIQQNNTIFLPHLHLLWDVTVLWQDQIICLLVKMEEVKITHCNANTETICLKLRVPFLGLPEMSCETTEHFFPPHGRLWGRRKRTGSRQMVWGPRQRGQVLSGGGTGDLAGMGPGRLDPAGSISNSLNF